jgi:hypothetical protein
MPVPPGMARVMLRSSPSSWCHCLRATRRRPLNRSNNSWTRCKRCGGSSIVPRMVSINQPRTVLSVDQHASPFNIFLTEAGSCRVLGSVESRGRRTSSKANKRIRRTRPRRACDPCAAPIASSTKTSKYCNFLRRRRDDRGALGGGGTVGGTGGPGPLGACVTAIDAGQQGPRGTGALRACVTAIDAGQQGPSGGKGGTAIDAGPGGEEPSRRSGTAVGADPPVDRGGGTGCSPSKETVLRACGTAIDAGEQGPRVQGALRACGTAIECWGQGPSGKGALSTGVTARGADRQGRNGKAQGSRVGDSVSADDAVRRVH